jgi:ribosome biogenesis GTPase
VDRGRFTLLLENGTHVQAVKARELGRRGVVVGDKVRVVGDLSGRKDTLARIVRVEPRTTELRRSTDEGGGRERVIVANADQMAICSALAQPAPRIGLIDRCLAAAYDAGMTPLLVLTKADLAAPDAIVGLYSPLGISCFVTEAGAGGAVADVAAALTGHETVLVGHSGVGKSTLINALVPGTSRETGQVNAVTGKGRHTSSSAVSIALPGGGRIIDTPGVRSFGLSHVDPANILRAFPELAACAATCPRGCQHAEDSVGCALSGITGREAVRVASFRRLLTSQRSGRDNGTD